MTGRNSDGQDRGPKGPPAGPHSLSLSISTEFEPGWDSWKEPRHGGLIKISGGGKSAPPSPLTAARLLGSPAVVSLPAQSQGAGGRQCATPPVPPRNHHHHVSTTYISQDRHTLIVTTPDSDRIPVKECVNGGGGGIPQVRTLRRPKADNTAVKPEIKINLAEPREIAASAATTVMVVPPVSISISGQSGGGLPAVASSQPHVAEKLRLREALFTEPS